MTLVALYTVGGRGAAMVSLVRIILVGFTFGNMGSLLYALSGGEFVYLPFLLVGGVVAGVLIGILGGIMVERVEKIMKI